MDGSDHNVLSDPGFERHFPKADRGNDPEDPAVVRTVPKGTFVNQWSAFQLDRILQAAETHGIAVQLCSHGDVYWTWDATVFDSDYATANGYRTGWTDPRHLGYWQRNYRYRIARWGYSTALLAWEVWNEHGLIDVPSEIQQFYQQLGRFVTAEDPYRHPFTTSQGSQAYSPAFWASTPTDRRELSRLHHDQARSARRRDRRRCRRLRLHPGRRAGRRLAEGHAAPAVHLGRDRHARADGTSTTSDCSAAAAPS